jgi:hypothetical protein
MTDKSAKGKNNLWVFREGKKNVSSENLLGDLKQAVLQLPLACTREQVIPVLLRAGELECGLADAGWTGLPIVQQVTDALAAAMLGDQTAMTHVPELLAELHRPSLPERVAISPAEGFAYYALHPNDFARLVTEIALSTNRAAVIGIRTIGATLSAITAAALRAKGVEAERITVRPCGHPYGRETRFTNEQLRWVREYEARSADFLVVDEGPGRSGSSFLSVGEALEQQGVPVDHITFLGSRAVGSGELCAADADRRWSRFRFFVPRPHTYERFRDDIYIGGGRWRSELFTLHSHSPACWPQMERLKFLSGDRRSLFKFEGFGSFGESARQHSSLLARGGFGYEPEFAGDGMTRYPVILGPCGEAQSVSRADLERLATYCAFRAAEFRVLPAQKPQLREMVEFNVRTEFGIDLHDQIECLDRITNVLVDGRMQPYEWIRRPDDTLMKVDANTHGDDHFFPGPTDIAWDLAGAIVEWQLKPDAENFLLNTYREATGDDVRERIPSFVLAYGVFRFAYCEMALATVANTEEVFRLQNASNYYRQVAARSLQQLGFPSSYTAMPEESLQQRC